MKNKGFTLVELLVVIAVLALLITMIVPKAIQTLNDSKEEIFLNEIRAIYRASETEYAKTHELGAGKTFCKSTTLSGNEISLTNDRDFYYSVIYDTTGNITYFHVSNGKYSIIREGSNLKIDELTYVDNYYTEVEECRLVADGVKVDKYSPLNYIYETEIYESSDGGYYLTGTIWENFKISKEYTADNKAIKVNYVEYATAIIVKYNSEDLVEWVKIIDDSQQDGYSYIQDFSETNDNGYIIAYGSYAGLHISSESTLSHNALNFNSGGDNDSYAIKYNADNLVEWVFPLATDLRDDIRLINVTPNNDIVFVAENAKSVLTFSNLYTESGNEITLNGIGNSDFLVIRLNSYGKMKNGYIIGSPGYDEIYYNSYIDVSSDGTYSFMMNVSYLDDVLTIPGSITESGEDENYSLTTANNTYSYLIKMGANDKLIFINPVSINLVPPTSPSFYLPNNSFVINSNNEYVATGYNLTFNLDEERTLPYLKMLKYDSTGTKISETENIISFFDPDNIATELSYLDSGITLTSSPKYFNYDIMKMLSPMNLNVEYYPDIYSQINNTRDGGFIITGVYYTDAIYIPAESTVSGTEIKLENTSNEYGNCGFYNTLSYIPKKIITTPVLEKVDYNSDNNANVFIIKLTSDFKVDWAKSFGAGMADYEFSKAINKIDGSYIFNISLYETYGPNYSFEIPASETTFNKLINVKDWSFNLNLKKVFKVVED